MKIAVYCRLNGKSAAVTLPDDADQLLKKFLKDARRLEQVAEKNCRKIGRR